MAASTPSQTVGPFFSIGLCAQTQNQLADPAAGGVVLEGRVLDGAGEFVPDAVVEVWAPPAWGRCGTDAQGGYTFTLKPPAAGYVPVLVFARGLLKPVLTRAYWPGQTDALLDGLQPNERERLTAAAAGATLRFDIHLQGDLETPFFVVP